MELKKINIVVVTFNSFPDIKVLIDSMQLEDLEDIKLTIVDNASTQRNIHNYFSDISNDNIEIIRLEKNVGFSRACNIGAASSKSDLLIFCNPDIEFVGNFNQVISSCKYYLINPTVGIWAPKLLKKDGSVDINFKVTLNPFALIYRRILKTLNIKYDESINSSVKSLAGAFIGIRTAYFEMVGRFNKNYFMYGDDIMLCRALQEYGLSLFLDYNEAVIHNLGTSSRKRKFTMLLIMYRGMLGFYLDSIPLRAYKFLQYLVALPFAMLEYVYRMVISNKNVSD